MMQPRDLFKITPITDEQEVELRNETHHVQIIEKWQAEDGTYHILFQCICGSWESRKMVHPDGIIRDKDYKRCEECHKARTAFLRYVGINIKRYERIKYSSIKGFRGILEGIE